jgi:formylglycine-generating enzyme required for sulfatase activity
MEVGKLSPNCWGLHDMQGNVWEFTASPWTRDHASLPERALPGKTQAVVTKGGSWFDGPEDCRAAARRRRLENELDINLGVRVVREI